MRCWSAPKPSSSIRSPFFSLRGIAIEARTRSAIVLLFGVRNLTGSLASACVLVVALARAYALVLSACATRRTPPFVRHSARSGTGGRLVTSTWPGLLVSTLIVTTALLAAALARLLISLPFPALARGTVFVSHDYSFSWLLLQRSERKQF